MPPPAPEAAPAAPVAAPQNSQPGDPRGHRAFYSQTGAKQGPNDFNVYAKDTSWMADPQAGTTGELARGALGGQLQFYRGGKEVATPDWSQLRYEGPQGKMTPVSDMWQNNQLVMPEGLSEDLLAGAMMSHVQHPNVKAAAYIVGQMDALTKIGLAVPGAIPGHGALAAAGGAMKPLKTTGVANQMTKMDTAVSAQMPGGAIAPAAPPKLPM